MLRYIKNTIKHFLLKRKYSKATIYHGVEIDTKSKLGKNCVLFSNVIMIGSSIDDYSYIQKNSEVINAEIGKFCSIASGVSIGLANHPIHLLSTSPVFYDSSQPLPFFFTDKKYEAELSPKTIIASDVWIGQNAMIKAGVTVGVGAVIGAGAVVVKDVEPYSIVVGVPAKWVKYRFKQELRERLLSSRWWEFEDEELMELLQYFDRQIVFLNKIGKTK